jgi:lauroyl/myristoyl acyltransferase
MTRPKAAEPMIAAAHKDSLVSLKDVGFAAALPALCAIAWLTTPRFKKRLASLITPVAARLSPAKADAERRRFVSSFAVADVEAFYRDVRTLSYHEPLNLLCLGNPIRRPPHVEVTGRDHLDQALAAGGGAILWAAPTTYGPMMTKVALRQAGFEVWHLSRPSHGFSNTRFGRAFLNPIRVRAEGRYLAGRIVIRDGNVRAALTHLTERLRQNSPVSITIGVEATKLVRTSFLAGTMAAAARPLELARQNGAPLLPVVTIGRPDGSFGTFIGSPLIAPDRDLTDMEAMQRLATFLEPHARQYPAQFAKSAVFSPET